MRERWRTFGRRCARLGWPILGGLCALGILFAPGAGAAAPAAQRATAPLTLGADPGLPDPLAHPADFRQPPVLARPLFRWWWSATPLDSGELVREVDAMAQEGFGGAEIAFGTGTWATDAQRQGLAAVLAEAKRLGLRMDMTFGASWPITTPATAPATGLSEQELQYGEVSFGGAYAGPVPPPFDDPTNSKGATLVAVTAARVQGEGDPAIPVDPGAPNAGVTPNAPASPPVLDPSSLVDLTPMVSSGTIAWTPPSPGHWIIFGLWSRPSSQNVMNEFYAPSVKAVDGYLDANQIGSAAAPLLPGLGRDFFEDSLELDANLFWTPDMLSRFRTLRGYDLTKYLPLLFIQGEDNYPVPEPTPNPDFDLPGGLGTRVRHDFYQTLQQLYETEHIQPFEAWSRSHGMDYRTQAAYGAPLDNTASARAVVEAGGIADDETLNAGDPIPLNDPQWEFALDHYRSVVAGVHEAGGKEVNSELGAEFFRDQEVNLGDYKAMMDKQWAAGMTRPIVHGFDYQNPGAAWPGADDFSGIVATSWNQSTMPEFSMFGPLAGYWARGNMVLQAGQPRIDVAVLRDGYLTTAATYPALGTDVANNQVGPQVPGNPLVDNEGRPVIDDTLGSNVSGVRPQPLFDSTSLERAGYTLEFVDPGGLTDPRAGGGRTLYPDGPAYQALVVDQSSLSAAAAQALAAAAGRGLRVVFVGDPPAAGSGAFDPAGEDSQVKAAIDSTLRLATVKRVATQADVLGALQALGVAPGARWSSPLPIYSQHRSSPSADYFYLWNADSVAHTFTASLASTGAPYLLDLWTGETTPLGQYDVSGGRTLARVTLQAGQTMVIGFRHDASSVHAVSVSGHGASVVSDGTGLELRDAQPGRHTVALSDGRTVSVDVPAAPAPVTPASWHLHVDATGPNGNTPYDLSLTHLQDWRNISQIQGESGTGTYTTTLDLPAGWGARNVGAILGLGQVDGAMQAYLNGQRVAPDIDPDQAWDVTGLVHAGANQLKVVVTTTLKNKIVSEVRSGGISSNTATYAVQQATQPYGLLGPVQLTAYGRAPLPVAASSASRGCVSARRLRFTIHQFNGRVTRVRIYDGRRLIADRRGHRITRVVINRPPGARVTLRILDTTSKHKTVKTVRVFRGCTAKTPPHTTVTGRRHRRRRR